MIVLKALLKLDFQFIIMHELAKLAEKILWTENEEY